MKHRTCIGILGGGQLARMSAYQAYKLGFDIAILEKQKKSPAGQLTRNEFTGWVDDEKVIRAFARRSNLITLENEFVDYKKIKFIEELGKKVIPSSKTIALIQDKLIQKQTLSKKGLPVPNFVAVSESDNYKETAGFLGKKFLLKSRKMGYDGYGNALVKNLNDYKIAIDKLLSRHSELLGEEFIKFQMELAVMIARTKKQTAVYPVVQTIQKNHICHTIIAPAQIEKRISKEAAEISVAAVEAVHGYGIFGIELFLTGDGRLLINEMAPRPHNSGHYSIEACETSQFENHIRSVLNLPLGSTKMVKPYAVMINLLGKKNGPGIIENYNKVLQDDNFHLHIYGKEISRIGRKMGHITLTGYNLKSLIRRAKGIEKNILI